MAKKREFGEGPIYTITNYIFWFFLGNLYFLLLNIPLLFMFLVVMSNGTNTLPQGFTTIIILCCIPIAPAATALFSVMGKLIREKDLNITKDFFKAYKTNFFQSLFFGALEIILLCVLFIDIRFFISSGYPRILTISVFVVMLFIFSMSLYIFPIISRFYLGWKDVVKTAAYYTIRKFNITLLCLSSFVVVGFIFFKITTFVLVFVSSIICYLIMYYQQKLLLEIEDKMNKTTDKVLE
ncbi:MAG: YesL family protein [Clostridium sp.]|uniref:YesL family protein n=1 Tax=Clostridium sp. TaxID=1506 RepID=UPI003D6CD23E